MSRLLNRQIRLSRLLATIKTTILVVIRTLCLFKKPFTVLLHYIKLDSPEDKVVRLRKGYEISLSSHRHDLTTAIVVFCRKDYGDVQRGSTVIDIGANIGAFSVYAAYEGASRVYAFEPSRETYELLLRNIDQNDLGNVVIPSRRAVSDRSNDTVRIPLRSSPYNRAQRYTEGEIGQGFELIDTISVEDIIAQNSISHVHLLKVDCEGAEYSIIPSIGGVALSRIESIRMEYHQGSPRDLILYLEKHKYRLVKLEEQMSNSGIAWFAKEPRLRARPGCFWPATGGT
jgi:FkbM family methyltransferase